MPLEDVTGYDFELEFTILFIRIIFYSKQFYSKIFITFFDLQFLVMFLYKEVRKQITMISSITFSATNQLSFNMKGD